MGLKGIYLYVFRIKNRKIRVGALGEIYFDGLYAYVGSDQRCLEKRIARHRRKEKKKRWHIDYVTPYAEEGVAFCLYLPKNFEEKLSNFLAERYEVVEKFGSSDLPNCKGNLFKVDENIGIVIKQFAKMYGAEVVIL